ncbi:MAG: NFACT family protein [Defluviitaleaceae bacterium]|nr:NFACT family protein [Defluviitaleaceae bacterium]
MPLDGATLSCVVHELENTLIGGRIDKITQPEQDEIIIAIRAGGANHRLLFTANAAAPRVHLTAQTKAAPLTAPLFCMVLRKHLSGGRLLSVRQPDFERIAVFEIESRNEMGDMARKTLLIEIMGKHSNLILTDQSGKVIDAIKHVSPSMSAVRTVLPGVKYETPPGKGKKSPLGVNGFGWEQGDSAHLKAKSLAGIPLLPPDSSVRDALFSAFNGVSPLLAGEICARAGVHPETPAGNLSDGQYMRLEDAFALIFNKVKDGDFSPHIYYDDKGKAVDITPWPFLLYANYTGESFDSPSVMLERFYLKRDGDNRLMQKTADLRKVIGTLLERCRKKSFAHEKSLTETENRDCLRIMGELLTAYLHRVERGMKVFTVENFYDGNTLIEIPLDSTLTPAENAQRYFKQYNKQKRASVALRGQMEQNEADIEYLESVGASLQNSASEEDVAEIRAELAEQGFVKRRVEKGRQKQRPSKPLHYKSSDGYDIYVGKNNTQNDQLTRAAHTSDIWLHTKDIAGSHVILMVRGAEVPERTLSEAANLAAYHSRAREGSNVPVDYVARKHVRKPAGAKPGYVIYDHHKTVYVTPKEPNTLREGRI